MYILGNLAKAIQDEKQPGPARAGLRTRASGARHAPGRGTPARPRAGLRIPRARRARRTAQVY